MVIASSYIGVTHSTICVYDNDTDVFPDAPINEATAAYCRQGFAWREGSVCFYTLYGTLELRVEVHLNEPYTPAQNVTRAIEVPFPLRGRRGIAIEAVLGPPAEITVAIPSGNYRLVYEIGYEEDPPVFDDASCTTVWCRLWFSLESADIEPRILVRDSELEPVYPLLMDAKSAE